MKLTPLTLLLVWAAPARADVAVPRPAAKKSWAANCAARLDEAAKEIGLKPAARAYVIPLRTETGKPNPVQYVEYATADIDVEVGDCGDVRADIGWSHSEPFGDRDGVLYRRYHNRFGKIEGRLISAFQQSVDDCLKMGEAK